MGFDADYPGLRKMSSMSTLGGAASHGGQLPETTSAYSHGVYPGAHLAPTQDLAGQLERIADLLAKGLLTEEEFTEAKTSLLRRFAR